MECGGALEKGYCDACELAGVRQFCVGLRVGALKELVNVYKFQAVRAAGVALGELVKERLGDYRGEIVPLPTIQRHVRERGFDHLGLIAKQLTLPRSRILGRAKNTVQVGASAEQRAEQAAKAYRMRRPVEPEKNYLLLDDIWTTGSTMRAALNMMKVAGAKNLAIVLIARNSTD